MICLILDSASAGSFSLSSCSISTVALLLSSVSGSSATASMSGRLWSAPSSEEEKPSLKPSNSLLTGLSLDFFVFFASLSDSSSSSCGLSSLLRPHPNWILKGSRLNFGNLNLKLLAFFSTASKSAFTSALSASISALAASRLLGSVMESSSASLPSSLCNLSSSMLMITLILDSASAGSVSWSSLSMSSLALFLNSKSGRSDRLWLGSIPFPSFTCSLVFFDLAPVSLCSLADLVECLSLASDFVSFLLENPNSFSFKLVFCFFSAGTFVSDIH